MDAGHQGQSRSPGGDDDFQEGAGVGVGSSLSSSFKYGVDAVEGEADQPHRSEGGGIGQEPAREALQDTAAGGEGFSMQGLRRVLRSPSSSTGSSKEGDGQRGQGPDSGGTPRTVALPIFEGSEEDDGEDGHFGMGVEQDKAPAPRFRRRSLLATGGNVQSMRKRMERTASLLPADVEQWAEWSKDHEMEHAKADKLNEKNGGGESHRMGRKRKGVRASDLEPQGGNMTFGHLDQSHAPAAQSTGAAAGAGAMPPNRLLARKPSSSMTSMLSPKSSQDLETPGKVMNRLLATMSVGNTKMAEELAEAAAALDEGLQDEWVDEEEACCLWSESTMYHDICRSGEVATLIKTAKKEKQAFESEWGRPDPYLDELMEPNLVRQRPLHVAVQTRRLVSERDGDLRTMEDSSQPGPELVTFLLTGRNTKNGGKVANVRRDRRGRVLECMAQDSIGMSPLHAACLSDCSTAFEIVCKLVEANPLAAGVRDMDGFLPIDHALLSPRRGSSDIVKVLLRAMPSSTVVAETEPPIEQDWSRVWEHADPCSFPVTENAPSAPLGDMTTALHEAGRTLSSSSTSEAAAAGAKTPVSGKILKASKGYVDIMLGTYLDGCNPRSPHLDLRYCLPQRVLLQYLLLDVDSCYHSGNISIPTYKLELTHDEIRDRVKADEMNSSKQRRKLFSATSFRFKTSGLADSSQHSTSSRKKLTEAKEKPDSRPEQVNDVGGFDGLGTAWTSGSTFHSNRSGREEGSIFQEEAVDHKDAASIPTGPKIDRRHSPRHSPRHNALPRHNSSPRILPGRLWTSFGDEARASPGAGSPSTAPFSKRRDSLTPSESSAVGSPGISPMIKSRLGGGVPPVSPKTRNSIFEDDASSGGPLSNRGLSPSQREISRLPSSQKDMPRFEAMSTEDSTLQNRKESMVDIIQRRDSPKGARSSRGSIVGSLLPLSSLSNMSPSDKGPGSNRSSNRRFSMPSLSSTSSIRNVFSPSNKEAEQGNLKSRRKFWNVLRAVRAATKGKSLVADAALESKGKWIVAGVEVQSPKEWRRLGKQTIASLQDGIDVELHIDILFKLFDRDDSGSLDAEEIFKGMSKLGYPVTVRDAQKLLDEADEDHNGILSRDEFHHLILKALHLPAVFSINALKASWKGSPEHSELFPGSSGIMGNIYWCNTTMCAVDARRIAKSLADTDMPDPRQVMTKIPYTVGESFVEDEERRRDELFKKGLEMPPIKEQTAMQELYRDMEVPTDRIDKIRRLPLHFACSNSLNPEASVMVRDVLHSFGRAAMAKDSQGKLPLHVACENESYTSVSMVRLLLKEYPDGAKVMDDNGDLPLHILLSRNHGDGVYEMCCDLIAIYPEGARMATGGTREHLWKLYPLECAMKNRSLNAAKVVMLLANAFPDVLAFVDAAGANLMHRFCWMKHLSKDEVNRELEDVRGISGALRAPNARATGYNVAAVLDALYIASGRHAPSMLTSEDRRGALPIHYACQNHSTGAREVVRRLIELDPHTTIAGDYSGNTPLHVVLGAQIMESVKIVAKMSPRAVVLPNKKHQIPVNVPGAWDMRVLFQLSTKVEKVSQVVQSLLSGLLAGLTICLARIYSVDNNQPAESTLSWIPLFLLAAALSFFNASNFLDQNATTAYKSAAPVFFLLAWTQLFIPVSGILSVLRWADEVQILLLLRTKRVEIVLTCLPLGILHGHMSMCPDCTSHLQAPLTLSAVVVSVVLMALSGLEQDLFRFYNDTQHPRMANLEVACTLMFRLAEAASIITCSSLVMNTLGVSTLVWIFASEVVMLVVIAKLYRLRSKAPLPILAIFAQELFDLAGVYHGFGKFSSTVSLSTRRESQAHKMDMLGTASPRDSASKFFLKALVRASCLVVCSVSASDGGEARAVVRETFLVVSSVLIVVQFLALTWRLYLFNARTLHMEELSRFLALDSWHISLFTRTSPQFLEEINELLVKCTYQAGETISFEGEGEPTMHYIVKGIATASKPPRKHTHSQSRIMGSKSNIFSSMASMAASIRGSVKRRMSNTWSTGLGSTKDMTSNGSGEAVGSPKAAVASFGNMASSPTAAASAANAANRAGSAGVSPVGAAKGEAGNMTPVTATRNAAWKKAMFKKHNAPTSVESSGSAKLGNGSNRFEFYAKSFAKKDPKHDFAKSLSSVLGQHVNLGRERALRTHESFIHHNALSSEETLREREDDMIEVDMFFQLSVAEKVEESMSYFLDRYAKCLNTSTSIFCPTHMHSKRRRKCTLLSKGDIFGEGNLIQGQLPGHSSAGVTARTAVETRALKRSDLVKVLHRHPAMTRIIIENVDMLNRRGGRHGPRLDPDAKLALLQDLHQVDITMHRSDVSLPETMGRASALVGKLADVIQGWRRKSVTYDSTEVDSVIRRAYSASGTDYPSVLRGCFRAPPEVIASDGDHVCAQLLMDVCALDLAKSTLEVVDGLRWEICSIIGLPGRCLHLDVKWQQHLAVVWICKPDEFVKGWYDLRSPWESLRLLKKMAEGKPTIIRHTIFLSKINEVILPPEGLDGTLPAPVYAPASVPVRLPSSRNGSFQERFLDQAATSGTSAGSNSQREEQLPDDGIFDRKASDESFKERRKSLGSIHDPKPQPCTITGLKKISKVRDEDGKEKQTEDGLVQRSSSIPMAETTGGDQWRMVESEGSAAMAETIGNIDDVVPLEVSGTDMIYKLLQNVTPEQSGGSPGAQAAAAAGTEESGIVAAAEPESRTSAGTILRTVALERNPVAAVDRSVTKGDV